MIYKYGFVNKYMKNKVLLAVSVIIVLLSLASVYAKGYSSLQEYENSINYTCQIDSDCVIKDIRNCCGYRPKCTNNNAVVNATFVKDICEREGLAGVCGFPAIDFCKCEDNKCVGKQGEPSLECKNLYWFDSDNKGCEQKEFCGLYMYQGLQTFESKVQCEKALIENKTFTLSNGRKAEVKIMPETASTRAIERLGELNFTVQLKEVGKGDDAKVVYELTGNKEGKFLGIFKIIAKVQVQVDAESGNVKVIKPWWAFLASGI